MVTKELLDSWYNIGAERDGHPNTRKEVRLGYVRSVMRPYYEQRLQLCRDVMAINPTSNVVIIGAGYGWSTEMAMGYCPCVGTEIGDYFFDTGMESDYEEVKAAIEAVGLDITQGRGLELMNRLHTPGPRMVADIIKEDSYTQEGRDNVVQLLGKQPDLVISEDVIQIFTPEEAENFGRELAKYGCDVAHYASHTDNTHTEALGGQPVLCAGGRM